MSPKARSRRLILTPSRHCPSCRMLLRPVVGGRGKMGSCVGCGYTGPMQSAASG